MLLGIDHWALMRWTLHIMVYCFNQPMTPEFMRCCHMSMGRWTKSSKCSIRLESVDLPIHRTLTKELIIKPKWEIPCTMETSWRTLDRAMPDNNRLWTISILNSIMEVNHLKIWTTKTSLTLVIEMVQALLALTQVELEATESEQPMVFHKIIRLIYSIWWTRGKHLMAVKTINNKWWWLHSNSSIQPNRIIIICFQAWIHLVRTPIMGTLKSQKPLLKLNLESREPIVVQAILFTNNMRTACL